MKSQQVQEIIQKLANATKTYYNANGHGKANRNMNLVQEYRTQLSAKGERIPLDEELLKIGEFNGEGSC